MFGSPYLMCAFGVILTLLLLDLTLIIFVYSQIVNSCKYFFGKSDDIATTVGRVIDTNDFCFSQKSQASSLGGLLIGMLFVYIVSLVGTYTRNKYIQVVNLVVCLPVMFLFGILSVYIGAAANNKTYTRRGNSTVVIIGVLLFLLNLIPVFLIFGALILQRKFVMRLDRDVEEERHEQEERFEMNVQEIRQQAARSAQQSGAAGRGGGGGRGGARGGAAAGRGGRGGRGAARGGGGRAAAPVVAADVEQQGIPAAGASDQYMSWSEAKPASQSAASSDAAVAAVAPAPAPVQSVGAAAATAGDAYQPPLGVTADSASNM